MEGGPREEGGGQEVASVPLTVVRGGSTRAASSSSSLAGCACSKVDGRGARGVAQRRTVELQPLRGRAVLKALLVENAVTRCVDVCVYFDCLNVRG